MVTFDVPNDRDIELVLGVVAPYLGGQLIREFQATSSGGGIRKENKNKAMNG